MKFNIGDRVVGYDSCFKTVGTIISQNDENEELYYIKIDRRIQGDIQQDAWFHEKQLRRLKPKVIQKTYIPVYPSQITQPTIEIVKNNRWYPNEENAMRWYLTGEDAMKYTDDPREMITITRKRIKPLAKPVD